MTEVDDSTSNFVDPTINFLPPAYRLHPWERWEYHGFVAGGLFAYLHNLSQKKPKWSNIHRYPFWTIGLGFSFMMYQRYLKEKEIRRNLIYLDYTRKHPEEFVKMESRTVNETWDGWMCRR